MATPAEFRRDAPLAISGPLQRDLLNQIAQRQVRFGFWLPRMVVGRARQLKRATSGGDRDGGEFRGNQGAQFLPPLVRATCW